MNPIIMDCERMKYSDTGLYHFCLNLGRHLQKALGGSGEHMAYYLPPALKNIFGAGAAYLPQNSLHKFSMPSLKPFAIWHSTYQDTDYMPFGNKRIRVVFTIHDLNYLYDDRKPAAKKQKYIQNLQRNINRSDAIVCISEYCRKDVELWCDTGNRPVHVIHNGSNTLHEATLSSSSYRPQRPYIFALGTVGRKKNFHVLLNLLADTGNELIISGKFDEPDYVGMIEAKATEMGVRERVHLTGVVSEEEKAWYYKHCLAFAFPSISEGFGLPVVEAMNFGKPLFLSDRTALPEIGGNAAFYFSNFTPDHMQYVFRRGMRQYNSNNLSKAIERQGRKFCWNEAAGRYLDVYRSLC